MNKKKKWVFIVNLAVIMLYGMLAGMTIMERKFLWFCIDIIISIYWIVVATLDFGKKNE